MTNVREHGAKGDGTPGDEAGLQQAIDTCAAAGGGRVTVPPGRYVCGTLRLRSGVELHLEAGATIAGSADPRLYPVIAPTPYGNLPGQIQAVLWAEECRNVRITGRGTIDGGADAPLSSDDSVAQRFRPALVFCRNCREVRFEGVTLRNSSFWTLHLLRCRDVIVQGVTIHAVQGRINTDGIDPDGCQNVAISDCEIITGDDAIVLKSTEGDVCQNVTVRNCRLSSACAAIKIGTESVGEIRNVVIRDCQVFNSEVGLALYMKDGGAYEDMVFSNIAIEARGPFPVVVDNTPRYYREPKVGRIRNVLIEKLTVRGPGRGYIEGHPSSPVDNLVLRDIRWEITGDCDFARCAKPGGARRGEWDPNRVNHAVVPAHFVVRHATGLRLERVHITDCRAIPKADRSPVSAESAPGAVLDIHTSVPHA